MNEWTAYVPVAEGRTAEHIMQVGRDLMCSVEHDDVLKEVSVTHQSRKQVERVMSALGVTQRECELTKHVVGLVW